MAGSRPTDSALRAIADAHRLTLIEDCSQAHFAEYGQQIVGTIGDLGMLSLGWAIGRWRRTHPRSLLDNAPLAVVCYEWTNLEALEERAARLSAQPLPDFLTLTTRDGSALHAFVRTRR